MPSPVIFRCFHKVAKSTCDLHRVWLSEHMYQHESNWMDFREISYRGVSWKSVEKFQILFNIRQKCRVRYMNTSVGLISLLPATWVRHKNTSVQHSVLLHCWQRDVHQQSHRTHCCVSSATMVTRTRHSAACYVHCSDIGPDGKTVRAKWGAAQQDAACS
jgi:hypothetical protein